MNNNLPERFWPAYAQVASLQAHERYVGAFIFGSVARGDTSEHSDFDVKVVVDTENACSNINHPIINGIKLDITFQAVEQLRAFTAAEIQKGERIPMLAESIIVFDKTGDLTQAGRLSTPAIYGLPRRRPALDGHGGQHYQIQGRWQVSDKRLLTDLAARLRVFASSSDPDAKYQVWSRLIDYILAPIGGRQPIAENNCTCAVCVQDLAMVPGTTKSGV